MLILLFLEVSILDIINWLPIMADENLAVLLALSQNAFSLYTTHLYHISGLNNIQDSIIVPL